MPCPQIPSAYLRQIARSESGVLANNPHHRDVVTEHRIVGLAPQNASHAGPVDEIGGPGESRLIARSVESDIGHAEFVLMAENERAVDELLIEVACRS